MPLPLEVFLCVLGGLVGVILGRILWPRVNAYVERVLRLSALPRSMPALMEEIRETSIDLVYARLHAAEVEQRMSDLLGKCAGAYEDPIMLTAKLGWDIEAFVLQEAEKLGRFKPYRVAGGPWERAVPLRPRGETSCHKAPAETTTIPSPEELMGPLPAPPPVPSIPPVMASEVTPSVPPSAPAPVSTPPAGRPFMVFQGGKLIPAGARRNGTDS